ncbi:C-C chemokine receptor 1-like protein 1 [Mya arenaria]|uniref:C-C chemokine receptor 1-like protein 1 n=1 Tax=Mya arenaria TaxID=6604 RepID=UPI0022E4BF7C|nr:C-C chemokine receptor 1-like protein 1 [Mya arenaria]
MESCDPHQFTECLIHYWLWLIVPGIQIAVGTSGNILNIIVLSRPNIRRLSTSVYLLSLAGADIVFLWVATVAKIKQHVTGIIVEDQSQFNCNVRYWIVHASAGYSIWLIVFMTAERLFLTKWPIIARERLTSKNAVIASCTLLAACLLFSSHYLFGKHLETRYRYGNNSDVIDVYYRCTPINDAFNRFYRNTWNLLILVVLNVIPVIIIIVGNINIVATIVIQIKQRRKVNPVSKLSVYGSRKKSTAKMLFVVSGFFMVTTLPFTIFSVLKQKIQIESPRGKARMDLYETIFVLLLYCNFTFNFFLYFVSGTMFKQEWKRLTKKIYDTFYLWVTFTFLRQPRTNVTVISLIKVIRTERNTV